MQAMPLPNSIPVRAANLDFYLNLKARGLLSGRAP